MDFTEQLTLAQDPAFRGRVKMAALTAALSIVAEPVTVASQEYHRLRQALAFGVVADPSSVMDRFSFAVACNVAITADSTDSDIQYTVNQVWDAMAGIPHWQAPAS
jgi:hypothetical protein